MPQACIRDDADAGGVALDAADGREGRRRDVRHPRGAGADRRLGRRMRGQRRRERKHLDLAVRRLHQDPPLAETVVQRVVIPVDRFRLPCLREVQPPDPCAKG